MRGLGKWLLGGNAGQRAALYQESVDKASAEIDQILEETTASREEVYRFLETAEVRTLVKSLYLFTVSDGSEMGLAESRREFLAFGRSMGLRMRRQQPRFSKPWCERLTRRFSDPSRKASFRLTRLSQPRGIALLSSTSRHLSGR